MRNLGDPGTGEALPHEVAGEVEMFLPGDSVAEGLRGDDLERGEHDGGGEAGVGYDAGIVAEGFAKGGEDVLNPEGHAHLWFLLVEKPSTVGGWIEGEK